MASIGAEGIRDPLEGVDTDGERILLDGFKRYRCARRLGLGMVPYTCVGDDLSAGIIGMLRVSNARSLHIVEQARLIDELRGVHGMSIAQIAAELTRSKAWVSVRTGIIEKMSETVRKRIFSGAFPAYVYLYTLRRFMRINGASSGDVDAFVEAVAGKRLSFRDIEQLAYGYFNGPREFRAQVQQGNIVWCLDRLRDVPPSPRACNEIERGMLHDLELALKYIQRVMNRSADERYETRSFFSQANLLSGGILSRIDVFSRMLRQFHDRTARA